MIIFPMMGLSSRFTAAGYEVPKYMLQTKTGSVFRRSVESFSNYFESEQFMFIVRSEASVISWIKQELLRIGISRYTIVQLNEDTLGQAHTVYLGLENAPVEDTEPIVIFNIDTFRPNFCYPDNFPINSNWLEVFQGEGEHWSFIEPAGQDSVARTTEKERISDLCSDGIYGFSSVAIFKKLVLHALEINGLVRGEVYVAPLYNYLIDLGVPVHYSTVKSDEIVFCGTPQEYQDLLILEKQE